MEPVWHHPEKAYRLMEMLRQAAGRSTVCSAVKDIDSDKIAVRLWTPEGRDAGWV